ncbi:vesicle-associated membrane protein 2 isoform X1 [Anopheles funestus]|uniref:vesicle-associated membrane protein 2 isoform X1 n=1 Tax=Anopheles funestus TaxID=62324 RepID=UPI0020C6E059|nr:vesicle-associated membrane protein 2 isoform X1 [Anopheles funestus]XP_049299813.1 vesicle-associated membrane protein 2 isoform X1 [Anopheles funestus]XP_049299814.1 vesicle-associated membrane protein 2 isoform X1 [Anopheles funestus]XP_052899331.1 vesicle-associated membrane protein 2 isoform X1 [Anopheles moucheti]
MSGEQQAESAPDGLAPGAAAGGEPGADGIVGGPRTPQQIAAQKRLQQTQAQVDEVVDIMKTNVEKVLERDQKLSELDDRADALQQGASQFEQQAGKLKRKFWLQNLKMMIIMGVIGLVILAIIVAKFMPADQPQQPMMMMGGQPMQQIPMQQMPAAPPAQPAAPAALVQDVSALLTGGGSQLIKN